MKIRLESNANEIREFVLKLHKLNVVVKEVSKFYPNRVDSTALLNGLVDTENPVGRVYVEIR